MTRYQEIIDVLIDTGVYEKVYFDHETELPVPYRGIGYLKRNALQEQPGKGRKLHKKWADICAIRNGKLRIIVEEERKPTDSKVNNDIEVIARCKYIWVDGSEFEFDPDCALFVLLHGNIHGVQRRVIRNKGSLKWIVVCDKEEFTKKYKEYVQ